MVRRLGRGVGYLAGTLVLGALGNGLWEAWMRPGFGWARNAALDVVSWGIRSQKDEVYRRVASGMHEGPALASELLLVGIWSMIAFSVSMLLLHAQRRFRADEPRLTRLDRVLLGPDRTNFVRLGMVSRVLAVFITATVMMMTIGVIRDIYVSGAVSHYSQVRAIVAPYVTEQFLKQRDSEFARSRNRQQYVEVLLQFSKVAVDNHLDLPRFDPW
jgi:hypothetical protein